MSDKIDHAILGAKAYFDLNFLKRLETCRKLEYRNTPRADLLYSSAQILKSKRLHSKISFALKLLEPCIVDVSDSINAEQSRQQFYYNKRSKTLNL